ncbi:sensor histidine kinase [Thalassotalea ganghwensis]
MKTIQHPFFKYSFLVLLLVDIGYTLALISVDAATFSLDTWVASAIWFVTFYWFPVWLSAFIIFKRREKGKQNTIGEWIITVILMISGNAVTDNLIHALYQSPKFGWFVILNGLLWGTVIYAVTRYLESRQKILIEQAARKQAQLESLRYQLNPHFMFNSLNTISAYIHSNPNLADEVLHELADVLRYSLDNVKHQYVPLAQELSIINKYLNIEKARFGDELTININIKEELKNIRIPPLLIQPIIENSIKHNAKQKSLEISLTIKPSPNGIEIIVEDNGKGYSQDILMKKGRQGIGLENVKRRVEHMLHGKLTIGNTNGAKTRLEMSL